MDAAERAEALKKVEALLLDGKFQEVLDLCDEILKTSPDNAAAFTMKGHAMTDMGKPAEALPFFKLARVYLPTYPPIRFNLAQALDAVGEGKAALAEYDEALRLDGSYTQARACRGALRQQLGDAAGALADYDELVRRSPEDARIRMLRGGFHLSTGRPDAARADFEAAVGLDPSVAPAIADLRSKLGL
jgi:tetratricopeptide (TPR) repeat protein